MTGLIKEWRTPTGVRTISIVSCWPYKATGGISDDIRTPFGLSDAHMITTWIALFLSACILSPAYLQKAEQALQDAPDSCLAALLNGQKRCMSKRAGARHALLLSLAVEKNHIDVTDDSLVRVAADYFRHHGSKRERMLSWYCLGRVRANAGNRIGGQLAFQAAEEYCREIVDDHYLGLILRNEGELYGSTYDYRQQQRCYFQSTEAFERAGDEDYTAYSRLALAKSLSILGDQNRADSLLHSLLYNVPSPLLRVEIYRSLAANALRQHPPRPDSTLSWYARCRGLSIELTPEEELDRGVAFALKGERDSALSILSSAGVARSAEESAGMAYNRARIHSLLGDDYASDIVEVSRIQDRLFYENINLSIAGFLGDYYRQDLLIRKQQNRLNALITVFPLLLLALLAVWSWFRFRERRQVWDATMVSASLLFSQQDEHLQALLKGRIRLLKQLADLYVDLDESDTALLRKKDMDRMELIVHFRKTLRSLRKDDTFWKGIGTMLDLEQGGLASRLEAAFPRITGEDRWILFLLYAGIPAATAGLLFQMPAATVRSRKARFLSQVTASDLPSSEIAFFTVHMPKPRKD